MLSMRVSPRHRDDQTSPGPRAFLRVSREPAARVPDPEADAGTSPVCFERRTGFTVEKCDIDCGDSADDANEKEDEALPGV